MDIMGPVWRGNRDLAPVIIAISKHDFHVPDLPVDQEKAKTVIY